MPANDISAAAGKRDVGVTAMPKADGSQSALEVHIFPEAMRGTGEGHYPWDLQPLSSHAALRSYVWRKRAELTGSSRRCHTVA